MNNKKLNFLSNNLSKTSVFLFLFLFPFVSLAQSAIPAQPKTFGQIICLMAKLALDFVPLIIVLAVVAFLQGLIKYVANGDNEEKRGEGTKMMIYGIVGLFFMVGIWGTLKIFTNSFALPFGVPQFKASGGTQGCGSGSSASALYNIPTNKKNATLNDPFEFGSLSNTTATKNKDQKISNDSGSSEFTISNNSSNQGIYQDATDQSGTSINNSNSTGQGIYQDATDQSGTSVNSNNTGNSIGPGPTN